MSLLRCRTGHYAAIQSPCLVQPAGYQFKAMRTAGSADPDPRLQGPGGRMTGLQRRGVCLGHASAGCRPGLLPLDCVIWIPRCCREDSGPSAPARHQLAVRVEGDLVKGQDVGGVRDAMQFDDLEPDMPAVVLSRDRDHVSWLVPGQLEYIFRGPPGRFQAAKRPPPCAITIAGVTGSRITGHPNSAANSRRQRWTGCTPAAGNSTHGRYAPGDQR